MADVPGRALHGSGSAAGVEVTRSEQLDEALRALGYLD